eukprot:CAMPEP_0202964918 /NCGR_PEP_ID=MMETSP1396-20130829/9046_1 /ASSEMBLY_ACC=CAM_ASM_000872 /TAXON_ID= /ORGANISM="Pseudokeronopsis sp., Strain Brazil" /LENGTH=64 /DNA_ID=CAMNT_0049687439 /DNA_START=423 /DNA_END=617 /DNA_ORIENTATION=+
MSVAARDEYHNNAFKSYYEKLEEQIKPLDVPAQPVLHNSQSQAMDEFIEHIEIEVTKRFGIKEE